MRRPVLIAALIAAAGFASVGTAASIATASGGDSSSGSHRAPRRARRPDDRHRSSRSPHPSGCASVLAHHVLPRGARCLGAVRADVTGGAGTQLVVLRGTASGRDAACGDRPGGFSLELVGGGAPVRTQLPCSDGPPFLVRVGNVNGVPGSELVLELDEISSGSTYGVYTFAAGRLRRVGPLLSAGGDSTAREGFSCLAGPRPRLVQRIMELRHGPADGPWRWTVITYAWRGPTLERIDRRRFVRRGLPHGRVIAAGADCGQVIDPLSTAAE